MIYHALEVTTIGQEDSAARENGSLSEDKENPRRSEKRFSYKDPMRDLHPRSAVIREGYKSDLSQRAVKPPVFRTTIFDFPSAEDAEQFFDRYNELEGSDGEPHGLYYTRLNNPNIEIFEDKMVAVEKGSEFASLFPSGMGAITTAILALVPKGGHVLFTNPLYGETYYYLTEVCPDRLDISCAGVDTSNIEAFREADAKSPRLDALFQLGFVY